MKQDIKALWVAELRNPNIKQGRDRLRQGTGDETSFCCLGVLCNLHAMAHPEIAAEETNPEFYIGESCYLPISVMNWAGLKGTNGGNVKIDAGVGVTTASLIVINDAGQTFAEIADAIEAQL